ncbi:uncharacterized protein [Nicotiana tomentosiformis]|uniref:uncharacterized protein n=1 Tax=Nicotiana tomentosiformis TaxID=4098 RepID=UPI00388CE7EB
MVKTRTTESDDMKLVPPTRAVRGLGRGRGRGGARGAARALTRAATEEAPVAPVEGQTLETPVAALGLQETLAQFLSMFGTLDQAGLIPLAPATSKPVVTVQTKVRHPASEEEQRRLEWFKKYDPPTFSGTTTNDAQGFLEKCNSIVLTMGIVEVSGVAFTIFQLLGTAYQWWHAYKKGRPADPAPLTWAQFSEMFHREFTPQTLRYALRTELEQLHHGTMTVSECAMRFSELSRHAPILVSTVRG